MHPPNLSAECCPISRSETNGALSIWLVLSMNLHAVKAGQGNPQPKDRLFEGPQHEAETVWILQLCSFRIRETVWDL